MANHGGTTTPKGSRNYGTQVRPSPVHGGSGAPKSQVHSSQGNPSPLTSRGNHGGTNLPRVLKRK
jgi:hypothetical protein